MKRVYVLSTVSYRTPVAFMDKDRADAVAGMCGADIREVEIVDAVDTDTAMAAMVAAALGLYDEDGGEDAEEGGDGDGL